MGLEVKVKKLIEEAQLPYLATPHAAAFDLVATSINIVNEKDYGYIEYGTGLAFEIPEGYCGKLLPRSSISKTGLILANPPGLIDSDYRGEVMVRFKYIPTSARYEIGDRIIQMRIEKNEVFEFFSVDTLSDTERNTGGFGSTGK